jgi:hypothetical protein
VRTVATIVAILSVASVAAHADAAAGVASPTDRAAAQQFYDEGTKHYDLGEWDLAITAFKQAYERMPDPLFLFDIAQSQRRAGHCREALDAYKAFVRDAPEAENRPKAEKFITQMDECVRRDSAVAVVVHAPAPAPRAPRLRGLHVAGITAAAGGLLLGVGGGVFSWRANDAASKVEALCRTACVASAVAELDARGKASDRDAEILYAAGGAAIVAGAAMFLWAEAHPQTPVAIAPMPGGAMVLAKVEF